MGELVLSVLAGAFGPFRAADRWFLRLPWWRKALWQFALTGLGVVAAILADRVARQAQNAGGGPTRAR